MWTKPTMRTDNSVLWMEDTMCIVNISCVYVIFILFSPTNIYYTMWGQNARNVGLCMSNTCFSVVFLLDSIASVSCTPVHFGFYCCCCCLQWNHNDSCNTCILLDFAVSFKLFWSYLQKNCSSCSFLLDHFIGRDRSAGSYWLLPEKQCFAHGCV